ncbi:MAG TPA: 4'-phosphopantetheinyl transferase superfamily protein [Prolixibacteraceae bacterium]|nr:4'-phosphopantetheinyl transferase superfamily protein [Prolixibacteraceae bacterium]
MIWEKSGEIPQVGSGNDILVVYGNHNPAGLAVMNQILTEEELAFANRFKVVVQKNTWISCRMTLRLILGTYLQLNPKAVEFKKNRFGRLSLANSRMFFNVSHTESSFLLGFSFDGRIGLDLDKLKTEEDLNLLTGFAFSDQETEYCRSGNLSDRFLEIWTLKEAFLKAAGVGLVDDLKAVNVYGEANNQLKMKDLTHSTFKCPNGETASLVYRKNREIRPVWLC